MRRPWALPLAPLYAAGSMVRWMGVRPKRLGWPVVSVGNLSAGGTGKTPMVIALVEVLRREGFYVDVLSRGYGRVGTGAERVDPDGSAEWFGDEPVQMAREAGVSVFVGAGRLEAGRLAEQEAPDFRPYAGVHLLDDGFQHRQLFRDVDIVLVNAEDLGDWLLPAGNLREPLGALRRATVFAVKVGDETAVARLRAMGLQQPVWRFRREMNVPQVDGPVAAFCGIARPEQFFAGLELAGVNVAARKAFRDHHRFEAGDLAMLRGMARDCGAVGLMTTAKDRVRMGGLEAELGMPLSTVGLRVVLEDEAGVMEWLRERLGG